MKVAVSPGFYSFTMILGQRVSSCGSEIPIKKRIFLRRWSSGKVSLLYDVAHGHSWHLLEQKSCHNVSI